MKFLSVLIVLALLAGLHVSAQPASSKEDKLGLPGDNLNLYAVMKLFQESETLEKFEQSLNDQSTKVNNLDLNNDHIVDYITVTDRVDGTVHNVVLQVPMSADEKQDVAVFNVTRDANDKTRVQLIGDEDLYGKDYIIEPQDSESVTPNPGYQGKVEIAPEAPAGTTDNTYVYVDSWPVVRYIYMPVYSPWSSPWYWGYYPSWWIGWRPFYWDYYYGFHMNLFPWYYHHYHFCHHYAYNGWRDHYYHSYRSSSSTYHKHREAGDYNHTYSRPDLRQKGYASSSKADRSRNGNTSSGINGHRPSPNDRSVNYNNSHRSASPGNDRGNVNQRRGQNNNDPNRSVQPRNEQNRDGAQRRSEVNRSRNPNHPSSRSYQQSQPSGRQGGNSSRQYSPSRGGNGSSSSNSGSSRNSSGGGGRPSGGSSHSGGYSGGGSHSSGGSNSSGGSHRR